MQGRLAVLAAAVLGSALAQTPCAPTPLYSRCELVFELNEAEAKTHTNPYVSVQLQAEFRSPRHRTVLMPAFHDGGSRLVIRFAPIDAGEWEYRLTSNVSRWNNQQGKFTATASEHPGFIAPANGHHWRNTENLLAHLWIGGNVTHASGGAPEPWAAANTPNLAFYKKLDAEVADATGKGLVYDMPVMVPTFPTAAERERYLRYLIARYAAFNITWHLMENVTREALKEAGTYLKNNDPYRHPRSVLSAETASTYAPDGWMDHIVQGTANDTLGAVEHQVYAAPFVNTAVKSRAQLWNAFMNGQYPSAQGSLDPATAQAFKVWFDFVSKTRYWELEPYFDLDGGRAVALPETEYIVYIEKPSGPVEVRLVKHGYDVKWLNPATGEVVPQKEFKAERYAVEPPSRDHDWVLHISREGRKEGMLRSYKFESRPFLMQEAESGVSRVPFEIAAPTADEVSMSKPPKFEAKLKRESRGTRRMMYLWTGEVPVEGQGMRMLGTGESGTWRFHPKMAQRLPAVMNMRLYGLNANGKLYFTDRVYRIVQ